MSAKVPALHGAASSSEPPFGQNEPGLQLTHADAALALMNEPPAHEVHALLRLSSAYDPGVQACGSRLPAGAQWPGAADVHAAAEVRPVTLENVPASHASGLAERARQ